MIGDQMETPVKQHTPGPWNWDYSVSIKADAGLVALVYSTPILHDNLGANAHLIAAAPDLLMALQMLYDETADYIRLNNLGGMDNHCMKLARAALARAVGGA